MAQAADEASRQHDEQRREGAESEGREGYYWDREDAAVETEVGVPTAVWHNLHWGGAQVFSGLEFVGEMFVSFFGLDESKYQWAIDAAEDERREEEYQRLLAAQRRQLLEERRRKMMEEDSNAPAPAEELNDTEGAEAV